jgi:serine/threonine-protein kinase RsbW
VERRPSAAGSPVFSRATSDNLSSTLSIEIVNKRTEIPRLAEIAERFGRTHHLSEDDVANIQLVLDEMVINVIRHGYEDVGDRDVHRISVTLALNADLLTIELKDTARAYDPREAPAPRFDLPIEERGPGGLGVHIVRSIMDTMDYRRENGQNIVTMTKCLRQD